MPTLRKADSLFRFLDNLGIEVFRNGNDRGFPRWLLIDYLLLFRYFYGIIAPQQLYGDPMNILKHLSVILFIVCIIYNPTSSQITILKIDGSINPSAANYLHEEISHAQDRQDQVIILELNTPGGLLKSTRSMVTDLLTSTVPIVVYVSPAGSQAASAGVFVTLAGHIAAMAPGTNIGAAHPVNMQGGMDSTMAEKATNDAAAFIRTISEKRNRNISWAEDAVRKSISITETEALQRNVIDLIARNRKDLIDSLDGKKIIMEDHQVTLKTAGAPITIREMGWQFKILDLLSDPNIAYILLMLGMYGLLFELYNPGSVFPGVVGAISLILALYSLHTLPINYSGIGLIILGIILFLLEIKITSYGLLTIGGIISLFLGSIMLFTSESWFEFQSISLELIIPTVIFTALFFIFAVGAGIRAQRRKPSTGSEGLIGAIGTTITRLNPTGQVRIQGEIWSAESVEGAIAAHTEIEVAAVAGLTVKVRARQSKDS